MTTIDDVKINLSHKRLQDFSNPFHFLSSFRKRDILKSFLFSIVQDPSCLTDIAKRSYKHENGFYRIDLVRFTRDEVSLRMHIWPQGKGQENTDIHDHSWDFYSIVLAGTIAVFQFKHCENGNNFYLFEHSNPTELLSGKRVLKRIGQYGLDVIYTAHLEKGSMYFLQRDILHTLEPTNEHLAITMVLQGEYRKNTTQIYSNQENKKISDKKRYFQPDELQEILTDLLDSLGG